MIILAREKPKKLEVLEAILRRLPDNDPNYDYYNDIYFRTKSGYDGEQKVDKEWSQINTHKSHYLLHNLELQNHQIDTLYICPNFLLILEIKNISGHLDFEYEKHQFLRTRNDGVFCKIKMQRIAMKNTECCHPIFLLFSRQRIG